MTIRVNQINVIFLPPTISCLFFLSVQQIPSVPSITQRQTVFKSPIYDPAQSQALSPQRPVNEPPRQITGGFQGQI